MKKKIVVINLLIIFLIFAGFEIGLRYFAPNAPFAERRLINVKYEPSGYSRMWLKPNQLIYNTEKGKVLEDKVKFKINKWGYRGNDFDLTQDSNEIRIAILGGSHVFDLNSFDYEGAHGFPELLEQNLNKKGFKCHVINAGVPGANTCDFPAKILFDLSRYSLDFVIINSIWNDTKWISEMDNTTQIIRNSPLSIKKNPMIEKINLLDDIFGWSIFYRKVRDFYWKRKLKKHLRGKIIEGVISNSDTLLTNFKNGLRQYKKNIIAAIKLSRQFGIEPILAIEERLVSKGNSDLEKHKIGYQMVNVKNHEELVSIFESCDQILKECSKTYQVPLFNANQFMEGDTTYFKDHVHTSPKGSEKIAEFYATFFAPLLAPLKKGQN